MPTDSELLALHDDATLAVQTLIEGVTDDELDNDTPCGDWDVQKLIGHLVAGNRRFAAAAQGESLMSLLNDITPQADAAAYAETAQAASAAWSSPAAMQQESAQMTVTVHLAETVMHGWDLARATDQEVVFADEALDVVEPFAHQMMPEDRPAEMGFAPPSEAPEGASRLDRLAAFYGRAV